MISSERYCVSCGAANALAAETCFACGLSLKITAPLSPEISRHDNRLLMGRYHILTQVGKGGFSAVYKAEDRRLNNQHVAIKAITLSGLKPHEIIEATEAFNREMQLLSDLKHPNLPHIYNHFADKECWYLVMDFIEGTTLEKHLETMPDGRLPVGEVLELGLLLCSVLEYLHSRQPPIIFRDLKPANIMLKPDGRIALIDFGIARRFKSGQARDTMPFGSPGYAAPEQYGKAQTTPRTDLYGLGVILHQLLTGDDPSQTPFRFVPLRLHDQSLLAALEPLILQMVDMDATKRPANVSVVKKELHHLANTWSRQHVYGLNVPRSSTKQQTVSWQSLLPPLFDTTAVGAGFTPALVPTQASAMSKPYTAPAPAQKRNHIAIASLTFGFLSIFIPLFICVTAMAPFRGDGFIDPQFWFLLSALLMLAPALLAIIFGHIGIDRADSIYGMGESRDIAMTGMILGYIFGSIYLGFLCLVLALYIPMT
ncbi:MAG: serine/threonine protein kinase [Ktedonobacteraceae bacterium]